MRVIRHFTVEVASAGTTSTAFKPVDGVFALIELTNVVVSTTIKPQIQINDSGIFRDVLDADGAVVTFPIASNCAMRVPDECFPCTYMRFVFSNAEPEGMTVNVICGS